MTLLERLEWILANRKLSARLTGRPAPWRFGIIAWPYREGPYMRCAITLDVERSVHTRAG